MKIMQFDFRYLTNVLSSLIVLFIFLLPFNNVNAMGEDDPVIYLGTVHSLNIYDRGDGDVADWDVEFSANKDLQKIHLIIEGNSNKRVGNDTEIEGEVRLQYARTVSAYWDATIGFRKDFSSEKTKEENVWLEFGFRGLSTYFIETKATVFLGEEGRSAFKLDMEKELMISESWLLFPKLNVYFNGYNESRNGEAVGSGLSDAEFSVKLAYRITRKFNPYAGFQYNHSFGNTKKLKEDIDEDPYSSDFFVGLKLWF